MPPQTRMTSVKESRILRSKKVRLGLVENIRISLIRCDNNTKGLSRTNNSPKKNIVKVNGKTSKSLNSPKPKEKQKLQPSPKKKEPSTKLKENSVDIKKPVAVKSDIRKAISQTSSPTITTKYKQSPKKPATTPENVKHKQSPIKTTTNKEIYKSEIRIKKPLLKKTLSKESRLKKQMKLGRIFIKPTFPIKTILKREIHSGDKEENQGQFVMTDNTKELNNNNTNNIVKRTTQPKVVLSKIDKQAEKPVRESRKILRHI